MLKLILFFTACLSFSRASTIDSGYVATKPFFIPEGSTVQVNFGSSDGNFSLFGSGILGGGSLPCRNETTDQCAFGTYFIGAGFPDATYGAGATVAIDGNPAVNVTIGCLAPDCPHTSVQLSAGLVDISGPGIYRVPFTATGIIQASTGINTPFILDQTISGVGLLSFLAILGDPGHFQILPAPPGGPLGLIWTFAPVPEPSRSCRH